MFQPCRPSTAETDDLISADEGLRAALFAQEVCPLYQGTHDGKQTETEFRIDSIQLNSGGRCVPIP